MNTITGDTGAGMEKGQQSHPSHRQRTSIAVGGGLLAGQVPFLNPRPPPSHTPSTPPALTNLPFCPSAPPATTPSNPQNPVSGTSQL